MRLTDALARLNGIGPPVFRTADVVGCLDIERTHASKLLARLAESGHLMRMKRGLWFFPDKVDLLAVPGHLTAPFPSYVSLQSALYYHGMISQIPNVIYAVSLARSRVYKTPVGIFSIHHVATSFFFGYDCVGASRVRIASPEKALLDFLYLSSAKTKLFRSLPELELSPRFSKARAGKMLRMVSSPARRGLLGRKFAEVMADVTGTGH
jgi:predicted transcriptional regulator of viral defense system